MPLSGCPSPLVSLRTDKLIRDSLVSRDSGLGEDPSQSDRESITTQGGVTENSPTAASQDHSSQPQAASQPQASKLIVPTSGFSSIRSGTKKHRKSMLLSELCVVTVAAPSEIAQGQKGKGAVLKFRFSPYTQIEFLRIAILKQFHERYDLPVSQISKLHLCRFLEDEEGWEWLEEDQALHAYQLPTECKLELKPLEPVYSDVRVVIPQLECSMSVEYDQFSTVGDVLQQVLSLTEPPLDPTQGYSLYHVRMRMNLDPSESMVYYQILPTDVLECRLSIGKLHSVIITIKIPSILSCRKVKVCLDETVGELISTLMRRVPDPDSPRWTHMALYLHSRDPAKPGIWMEDYKFLAAYKLKASDVIEFRPKYRSMTFELRVYPHDHSGEQEVCYGNPELLVAQDTLVSEILDLLCNSASLEYDPRFYGLFLHDDSQLPSDMSMWDHLDEVAPSYQDGLVMHMIHKPVQVLFQGAEDSVSNQYMDFSQPCRIARDFLCRRYGVRYHTQYGLYYEGVMLKLSLSLHNQGVVEQEQIVLVPVSVPEPTPFSSPLLPQDDKRASITSMIEDTINIWDEGPDSEQNFRYDKKRGVVVAASFNKLVERITSSKDHDMEFVKTFLYTYQSFATPEKLLKKLIERYNVVRPEGMSFREFAVLKQTIQARVINALRLWVELSVDFKDNTELQQDVLAFINTVLIMDHPRLCKPLRNNILSIKGVIQKKNVKMFRDPPPPVKFPANPSPVLSIFDFDPEEIARQLTIIDFSLFAKIKPAELLNQAWQKAKYRHRAGNILRLVERMNNLTLWVATTILSQRDVHERAKRVSDCVQVSIHLHRMHNFCTLLSVLNGLAHPAITRLKKSFSKMDKSSVKKLEELQSLARPGDNFRILRDELKKASNPCIPYLGLYMSDLTFLDNGNPNFHSSGLINFSKCRLIYHQIRDLILRQDKSYNFEEVPALHESLIKFNFLDTDVLYDVSLQREPRDKGK